MTEEPCQCSDCQRFYKEHDRLIREFPTFKQQQELNWASIQSFRTLCTKVTDELQRELSERESNEETSTKEKRISKSQPNDLDLSIVQARCLCWLALLAEAHEDHANAAEKREFLPFW